MFDRRYSALAGDEFEGAGFDDGAVEIESEIAQYDSDEADDDQPAERRTARAKPAPVGPPASGLTHPSIAVSTADTPPSSPAVRPADAERAEAPNLTASLPPPKKPVAKASAPASVTPKAEQPPGPQEEDVASRPAAKTEAEPPAAGAPPRKDAPGKSPSRKAAATRKAAAPVKPPAKQTAKQAAKTKAPATPGKKPATAKKRPASR